MNVESTQTSATKAYHHAIVTVLRYMREGEGAADDEEAKERVGEGDEDDNKPRLRFELAFIMYFRKEGYAQLSLRMLRRIHELDFEYAHLQTSKARLLQSVQANPTADKEQLDARRAALRAAESLAEVDDVQVAVQFDLDESEAIDETTSRRPARRGLYHAALKGKASLLADKFGLTPADVIANICQLSKHAAVDDLLLPEEAARDFIDVSKRFGEGEGAAEDGLKPKSLPAELRSTGGALAAAREWFAHALAGSFELRRTARSHFGLAALVMTEVTREGKDEIDTAHPLYRVVSELSQHAIPLVEMIPQPPPYHTRESHAAAVRKAELVLLARKASVQVTEPCRRESLSLIHDGIM